MRILGERGFLGSHLAKLPLRDDLPDVLINAAGVVKGILGNIQFPADMLEANIIAAVDAFKIAIANDCKRVVNFGSTCAYSPECRVPFRQEDYLKGEPEWSNRAYAVAKRTILELGWAYNRQYDMENLYIVMPNLYGPGDHSGKDAHVIPSMIMKFMEAKREGKNGVTFLGTGVAEREFLYVEDAARSIPDVVRKCKSTVPVHLTSGLETIKIRNLAHLIAEEMQYDGLIQWDPNKPDGQLKRKLTDQFVVKNPTSLREGLKRTIAWFESKNSAAVDRPSLRV